MPLRLRVVSDLHVVDAEDEDANLVPPMDGDADTVLAVLGDVISAVTRRERLRALFQRWAAQFRLVLFVPGNHEFYDDMQLLKDVKTVPEIVAQLRADAVDVRVLADGTEDAIVVDHVRLLGATLWSHVPEPCRDFVLRNINDYNSIMKEKGATAAITVDDTNAWHAAHVAALRAQLEAQLPPGVTKTVVLTHHAPLVEGTCAPKYKGEPTNTAFATDLRDLLTRADVWAFGHTHWRCDFVDAESGCRILSNPRGYNLKEVPNFDPELVLEL